MLEYWRRGLASLRTRRSDEPSTTTSGADLLAICMRGGTPHRSTELKPIASAGLTMRKRRSSAKSITTVSPTTDVTADKAAEIAFNSIDPPRPARCSQDYYAMLAWFANGSKQVGGLGHHYPCPCGAAADRHLDRAHHRRG